MKAPFKYLLMAGLASSAAFQVVYGGMLLANPSLIGVSLGLSDVSTNIPLLIITKLYGKLFITVGLLSSLSVYMVQREMRLAVLVTLLIAVNLLVTGPLAYGMTRNVIFLYADLARGATLIAMLGAYHYERSSFEVASETDL